MNVFASNRSNRMLLSIAASLSFLGLNGQLAAINVAINAGTVIATIPYTIYGINMADWNSGNNGQDPVYLAAMKASGCRNVRWPGGSGSDVDNWNALNCQNAYEVTTPQFIYFLNEFGGSMDATVNFSGYWCGTQYTHAQAVSLATQWVTWNMTNTGAAKAKYWEIGNEDYGGWEQGNTNGTTYGQEFVDYYKAMKAIDPTILIGAVSSSGSTDYNNWEPNMLTAAKAGGVVPDFLIIHNYPGPYPAVGTSQDLQSLSVVLGANNLLAQEVSSLNGIVSSVLGSSYVGKVKYFNTEYNINNGPTAITNTYINAMFCSQYVLDAAKSGWLGANLWDAENGGSPDFGFINAANDKPYPNYYVYPMLTGKFGTSMVTCTSSDSNLGAFAAKDSSGNLTLFLVNNYPNSAQTASISVAGFNPALSGNAWIMLPNGTPANGAPQEAPNIQINGNVNPNPASIAGIAGANQSTGSTFAMNLQPNEMCLLIIPPSGPAPTPTPCASTPIIFYAQINGGAWQQATSASLSTTAAQVNLGPQPLTGGSWSWTGPGGFTSTLREIDQIPLTVGNNAFQATYTDVCGVQSTATFVVTVEFPTATPTGTAIPTLTLSPSATATKTVTSIQSASLTESESLTASETPLGTLTDTPTTTATTLLTATWTLSATPSATVTSVESASPSGTPTVTMTGSPMATASASASMSSSVTDTLTASSTASESPAATATGSPTISGTSTVTASATGSSVTTRTATATTTSGVPQLAPFTFTVTVSNAPVALTLTGSNFLAGDTVSVNGLTLTPASLSSTQIVVEVPKLGTGVFPVLVESPAGPSNTIQLQVKTPPATTSPSSPLVVSSVLPVPNPNPKALAVNMEGPADGVTVRIYTKAFFQVLVFSSPPLGVGWSQIAVPGSIQNLPNGVYYVQIQAFRGTARSLAVFTKWMVLR